MWKTDETAQDLYLLELPLLADKSKPIAERRTLKFDGQSGRPNIPIFAKSV